MSKLSLDALKNRAEAIASEELMATINGGTENSCHGNATYNAHMIQGDVFVQIANGVSRWWNSLWN
jgi:hypothetical protein